LSALIGRKPSGSAFATRSTIAQFPKEGKNYMATNGSAGTDLLNIQEVAILIGCSSRTIQRYRSLGLLPSPVQIFGSRLIRWRRSDIEACMKAIAS
jgi:predicted DNA-binding transcriptional regulator AlpA